MSIPVSAMAARFSSEQEPASASSCVGVPPDCWRMGANRHELMLVVRLLGHGLAHDQLQGVDRDLRVVALEESAGALHDPRLRIGEIVLRRRLRFGGVRRLARGGGFSAFARARWSGTLPAASTRIATSSTNPYQIAGIDIHKAMLAIVVADVEV